MPNDACLDQTTRQTIPRALLHVAAEILAICRDTAWRLYKARDLGRAEIVARGLVACDDQDWYHHALLAATLRKQRRFREALAQVDAGLAALPGQADLLALRAEIFAAAERLADVERKLALTVTARGGLDDEDGSLLVVTPAQRRRHHLEMIRLVTDVLEADEEAATPGRRAGRA
ncbi:MAG TPA: hypothetical protein VGG33_13920 [Polyangia bacterium]